MRNHHYLLPILNIPQMLINDFFDPWEAPFEFWICLAKIVLEPVQWVIVFFHLCLLLEC